MAQGITVLECRAGHAYVYNHGDCPDCGRALEPVVRPAIATLIGHTTVRVNPRGKPVKLGIAELDGGAKTLCIIEGELPSAENKPVRLFQRKGLFHAERTAIDRDGA